jgi:hypothetical protein
MTVAESMTVMLCGKWLSAKFEGGKWSLITHERDGDGLTPKEAAKAVEEITEEIGQIAERMRSLGGGAASLVKRALEPVFESSMLYDDILALTSKHAREIATERFYHDVENQKLVLTVTNCEPQTHRPNAENVYRVSGYTTPRKKALRGTLRAKAEGVIQNG